MINKTINISINIATSTTDIVIEQNFQRTGDGIQVALFDLGYQERGFFDAGRRYYPSASIERTQERITAGITADLFLVFLADKFNRQSQAHEL